MRHYFHLLILCTSIIFVFGCSDSSTKSTSACEGAKCDSNGDPCALAQDEFFDCKLLGRNHCDEAFVAASMNVGVCEMPSNCVYCDERMARCLDGENTQTCREDYNRCLTNITGFDGSEPVDCEKVGGCSSCNDALDGCLADASDDDVRNTCITTFIECANGRFSGGCECTQAAGELCVAAAGNDEVAIESCETRFLSVVKMLPENGSSGAVCAPEADWAAECLDIIEGNFDCENECLDAGGSSDECSKYCTAQRNGELEDIRLSELCPDCGTCQSIYDICMTDVVSGDASMNVDAGVDAGLVSPADACLAKFNHCATINSLDTTVCTVSS